MFHWICPECGREIAPQAKECSACEPAAVAVEEAPAPLQPRVSGAPQPPASAVPMPVSAAGGDLSPVAAAPNPAQVPTWEQVMPVPEPARAPQMSNAPLREPQAVELASSRRDLPQVAAGPELTSGPATLPTLTAPEVPAPPMAVLADYGQLAKSQVKPAVGTSKILASSVQEQLSLPGPTLPHELTSLDAAGIARILVPAGQSAAPPAKSASWLVSFMVAAAVLAGTLGATFYAMPGLANSSAPKTEIAVTKNSVPEPEEPKVPVNPLARIVEVTGVRFVTDIPGRAPQIHYLVVNHSNLPLTGVTVNVTLKDAGASVPISQFAFRAPRLGAYESKEMVSSIERFNKPVSLPDWRDLRTEIQITQ